MKNGHGSHIFEENYLIGLNKYRRDNNNLI
jgi:hypothetical protein